MAKKNKCETCGSVAAGNDGLCKPCRIEKESGTEARVAYMAAIGRKGAEARNRAGRLKPGTLPKLLTPASAEVWLEAIGRALLEGSLADRDAIAGVRAVEAWLKAHGEGVVAKDVAELREALDAFRKRGKLKAMP
jgi:hypothetical protein